ncbi:MAG: DNA internalization-related competence protein ComEC/Rec2 [Oceanospirillaceae bacterium]|nr:DNA internalization-related competence protein ComEC/Rec2 [Oceanospirillaceae bacterium]MBT12634.1 DNA internalization-related competence protein ComEC/Rec2 [Oceanospirillaceae bacterium]|tara:strand:- start:11449 stop:13797 length:2349 start_codon:yes stop_codon:yes gene_type:complete
MHKLMLSGITGVIAGCFITPFYILTTAAVTVSVVLLICALWRFTGRHLTGRKRSLAYRLLQYSLILFVTLLFSALWRQSQLQHRLPQSLDRSYIEARVLIDQVTQRERGQRLRVTVLSARMLNQVNQTAELPALRQLQLNWYPRRDDVVPRAGNEVVIRAVLRAPRNFANGLAFDYEAYLLTKGIDAGGYIRSLDLQQEQQPHTEPRQQLRQTLLKRVTEAATPWVAGLLLADQQAFSARQWRTAAYTGTLHLLVVSGLHVGLIALAGWLIGAVVMRLVSLVPARRLPSPGWLRLLPVVAVTGGYVWLAGAGIALQRAWLMILLAAVLAMHRRRPDWLEIVLAVMLLVLLFNPLIWTRPGFGFSFVAVIALLAGFRGRKSHRLEGLILPQWQVFMALLPVMLWWGQSVGAQHLLANIVAIPWLTLVLMPLTLLAVLTSAPLISDLLAAAGDLFWAWLEFAQQLALPQFAHLSLPVIVLWYLLLIVFWLGVPRWLMWAGQACMLWALFLMPPAEQRSVMMADVGQGLAVIFRDGTRALIYDMGARFSERFDAGSAIVFPLLRQSGAQQVDQIMISHNDNDHAGGLSGFLRLARAYGMPVGSIVAGQPQEDETYPQTSCDDPQAADGRLSRWQNLTPTLRWRMLAIPLSERSQIRAVDNNQSCVIQVDWHGLRFMLSGDLEKDGEALLVSRYGAELQSDILLVGHHGSKTSTSPIFLNAVKPAQAWISAGFNNRFGHPHAAVMARLQAQDVRILNTAGCGLVRMKRPGLPVCQRHGWQPPWRQR